MTVCACGCGIEPKPGRRFIRGHHARGALHYAWKGGKSVEHGGYVQLTSRVHRGIDESRREHILVAERAMGKPLPPRAEVHHVDGNPANNAPGNLVICQDDAYHKLLHQRQRALTACGHADWRPCVRCHQHDDPARMLRHSKTSFVHSVCQNNYVRRVRRSA